MNKIKKIAIRKYDFHSDDVPPSFEGVRIAFLSDIHHGRTFSLDKLTALFEMTNRLEPDIILLGGDYVTNDPECIVSFFDAAKALCAPLGIYGVLGNHDRNTDARLSEQCMRDAGITLLDNYAVWVRRGGDRIRIGGVGDMLTHIQDIRPMLEGTMQNDLMILVTHHPDYARLLPENRIDLMLCGHTHGGQVSFLGRWAPHWPCAANPKYLTGIVKEGKTTVIISNGIGTVGPPIRLFATPQIWEITLRGPSHPGHSRGGLVK